MFALFISFLPFLFSWQGLFAQETDNYSIFISYFTGSLTLLATADDRTVVPSTSITRSGTYTFYLAPNEKLNIQLTAGDITSARANYSVYTSSNGQYLYQYYSTASSFYFPNPCPHGQDTCTLTISSQNWTRLTTAKLILNDSNTSICSITSGSTSCIVTPSDILMLDITPSQENQNLLMFVNYERSNVLSWKQNNFATNVLATTYSLTQPESTGAYIAGDYMPIYVNFVPGIVSLVTVFYNCPNRTISASDLNTNQLLTQSLLLPSDCYGSNNFIVNNSNTDLILYDAIIVYQPQTFASPTDHQVFLQGQPVSIQLANTSIPSSDSVIVTIIQTCFGLPVQTYEGNIGEVFSAIIPKYFSGTCSFAADQVYFYSAAGPISITITATSPPMLLKFTTAPIYIALGIPFALKISNLSDASFVGTVDVELQCDVFGTIYVFYNVPINVTTILTISSVQEATPLTCALAIPPIPYFTIDSPSVALVKPFTTEESKAVAINFFSNSGNVSGNILL